jgi:hypothetical protein
VTGDRAPTATLIATLLAAVASCGQPAQSAASQRLWTSADLQASFHGGSTCVNPANLPCDYFVAQGTGDEGDVLQFKAAFSEGQPMGYITTDFWANYPQIWLEPMYILVTAWNDNPAGANRLRDENGDPSPPIFSIGTQSAFWSPFWQTFYVEVPAGTPSTKYTSTRQLFDDHLVMHPGPNRFASIAPNKLSLPSKEDISTAITDLAPTVAAYLTGGTDALAGVVNSSKTDAGWLDGVLMPFFDFGTDNFEANADQEIQDVPLFLFEKYDADGVLKPMGVSNVGGVAPLFSHVPGRVGPGNRPQFGALWRLHIVTLPPKAAVFTTTDEAAAITPGGLTAAILDTMVGRVVLDASCFGNLPTMGLIACTWLDSQRAIEDNLGEKAIQRTDLQPACPFVMWKGLPVRFDPPPPVMQP